MYNNLKQVRVVGDHASVSLHAHMGFVAWGHRPWAMGHGVCCMDIAARRLPWPACLEEDTGQPQALAQYSFPGQPTIPWHSYYFEIASVGLPAFAPKALHHPHQLREGRVQLQGSDDHLRGQEVPWEIQVILLWCGHIQFGTEAAQFKTACLMGRLQPPPRNLVCFFSGGYGCVEIGGLVAPGQ
jgi:hypothetical protein